MSIGTTSTTGAAPLRGAGRTALVTGASAGIGQATARELARQGFRLIVCGRRVERLTALQAEFPADTTYTLTFDVRDRAATEAAIASLPEAWRRVDVLINSAGGAHGLAPIQTGEVADWDAMIDSNVKGLLYVTRAVLPLMPDDAGAQIVNISSIAGRQTYPNGAVYCASKAAVDRLTEGLRFDLAERGIRVAQISPGAVETEFSQVRFKGDEVRAAAVYKGYDPLTAVDIAETIGFLVTRPAHVNLADVLMLPAAQAAATTIRRQG
jgi:3-hydroxy acid dehydrogenase / malonic semialdehyde reductase